MEANDLFFEQYFYTLKKILIVIDTLHGRYFYYFILFFLIKKSSINFLDNVEDGGKSGNSSQ